jgi:copper chaperone
MADATLAVAAPVEAQTEGAEHTYKFNVSMSCGGCSGAVNRVLGKLDGMYSSSSSLLHRPSPFPPPPSTSLAPSCPSAPQTISKTSPTYPDHQLTPHPGVKSYDVSLDTQTATVIASSTLEYDTVLRTIAKTGKKVNSGEADGESRSVEVVA